MRKYGVLGTNFLGGTNGKAPLGYLNHQGFDSERREYSNVILGEERTSLVRQAFELYATGDWTAVKLASRLNRLGPRTLATARVSSSPITESYVYRILGNPYYTGVVRFQGVTYVGRHEPLTDTVMWQRVQDILKSHNQGERTRKHPH
ncbi:recombinase family protein [Leucobacter sp. UT-8R-CII-1-4]|uniref:recombinase family protein n=1 Tax=Leucobacter sp. UT-8R-CII-1-4 TaxID=3040075 RepID=UPI0024A97474|nr:recombinase family protein [Leucobacter sp. UT-8R-CII-1-4]MDI6023585.1 recombinase family protein [Leucobacter sp. UT-8R-CII-1-4]